MPRPAANPYHVGDALRATLNTRDTAILDYVDEAAGVGGATTVYGNDLIGATTNGLSINHSVVIPIVFPGPGTVTIEMYAVGDGGTGGSVALRGVVYDGIDATSPRVSTGVPAAVAAGDAGAWVVVGDDMSVNGGTQYVGYQIGGTNGVATTRKQIAALGSSYFNNDTYSDGAAATFGTATADTAQLSIRATYTPIPPAAIGGLTVQNQGVQIGTEQAATTLNVSGELVSLALASGVATITVTTPESASSSTTYSLGNFPLPASAVVESDPLPASVVIANVIGDQNVASLYVQDTNDAVTWRTRASGGSTPSLFMDATGISSRPLMRAQVTNAGTAQTDFQFEIAVT